MPKKNKHAVKLGKNGGKARSLSLSQKRRIEIAKIAAQSRWKDRKVEPGEWDE